MNLENAFTYATHHSEAIIQWVFLAILLLSGFLIARGLFGKKGGSEAMAGAGGGLVAGPSPELQGMLDKIMAQTTKLESLNLKDMPAGDVAAVDAQVQALKKDLAARESEIASLKEAGPSKTADDAGALNTRIKELEAKLSEYEILEDDIADLSLYKEENIRLRSELEKVKGGGAAAAEAAVVAAAMTPAPAAVPEPAPAMPEPPSEEAIVAEFAKTADAPAEPEPVLAQPAPPVPMSIPDTGDPMKDFESTVQLERALQGAPAPAASAPAPAAPAAPAQAAAPAAAASPQAEADDLFAEFATPVADTDPNLEGSTLDTDKMMAEMAALVSMEPASGSALEDQIDIEKMATEAKTPGKS